jgi:N-acetylglutamate synthase-like GNAT family acetyltransferase
MSIRETYSVRVADPGDDKSVSDLLSASYPALLAQDYDPRLLSAALPLMTKANPRLLASGTYYVAVNGSGGIIGCGGWTVEAPGGGGAKPGIGHIRHFAVHPDWTRRGVGQTILKRCFDDASARGLGTLECYSTLTAAAFYESAGFLPVAKIAVPMSSTVAFPSVLMRYDFRKAAHQAWLTIYPS